MGKRNKATKLEKNSSSIQKGDVNKIDILSQNDTPQSSENNQSIKRKKRKSKKLIPHLEDGKTKSVILPGSSGNSKIKFLDGEEQDSVSQDAPKTKKKKGNYLNEEEREVKDEDIDQFCDELGDEDNKQYEDWVKLIEANFHSKKKIND